MTWHTLTRHLAVVSAIACFPLSTTEAQTTFMVPMIDGVHLATDVYFPGGAARWPTILYRTPYGRQGVDFNDYLDAYAVVIQDVRGTGASEGEQRPFLDDAWCEPADGAATIAWIKAQSWSNGKVGTHGYSAPGILHTLLAGAAGDELACHRSGLVTSNVFTQAIVQGGAFRKSLVEGWLGSLGMAGFVQTIIDHPVYDDLWRCIDLRERFEDVNSPGSFWAGWYDIFLEGTIDSYSGIQEKGGPLARGNQRLVIFPIGHDYTRHLDLAYPRRLASEVAYNDPRKWSDYWLREINTGVLDQLPVRYYLMGDPADPSANVWISAEAWPVATREFSLYLHPGGILATEAPEVPQAFASYIYDPDDPVPTVGGANLFLKMGPADQRSLESRSDVLLYSSDLLEEPVTITGKVKVQLWVASSAPDTDFTAKLTDVYPDGRSMLVCDGILRMRHREGLDRYADPMIPGELYPIEIHLSQTALVFGAGHRIRVAVSSSNSPRFEPNPNTGELFGRETHAQAAENTVLHDAFHPSRIIFKTPDPTITVTPGSLDFGDVAVGETKTHTVLVQNNSKAVLTVYSIMAEGSADLSVTLGGSGSFVRPGGRFAARVLYSPSDSNEDSGLLTISSNDPERPLITISLSGRGLATFSRGDCNDDGAIDISDAVRDFRFCFSGESIPCAAACDIDGDGNPCTGVTDGVRLLQYLFRGGEAPPLPFPECGPAEGGVDCETSPTNCQ